MKIFLERIDLDENGNKIATFEVDGKNVQFSTEQADEGFFDTLIPGAIVECEIVDQKIVNPVILLKETKETEEKMKNRLHSLFARKKK